MNTMNKEISKKFSLKIILKHLIQLKKDFNFTSFNKILKTKKLKYPLVIKPNNEGSSIGVKICTNSNS